MFTRIRWDMRLTDERVVAFLAREKEPISQEQIALRLGCHYTTIQRSIKRLRGIVTPVGKGRGAAYRYVVNTSELPEHLQDEINRKS